MRIGRVDHDGHARTAVIDGDGVRVFEIGISVIDVLGVDPVERERIAARVEAGGPLARRCWLVPVEPPTIRDFSVFEEHIPGGIKDANPDATVPPVWYESPFCYFNESERTNRPRRGHPSAAGLPAGGPRARGRGGDRPLGLESRARRCRRAHRRLHDLQRWSAS